MRKLGHSARIDFLSEWNRGADKGDDICIVLRGLSRYTTKQAQYNIMWLMSHPDEVTRDELNQYDLVYVASETYAAKLAKEINVPVEVLLQCADDRYFNIDNAAKIKSEAHDILFVGNTRNQYRQIIRDCIEEGIKPAVYGKGWGQFINQDLIKGQHIPYDNLPGYYSRAKVVLNDHWPDMRDNGFINNRVYDALACGANIISDACNDIEDVLGNAVKVYKNKKQLRKLVNEYSKINKVERERNSLNIISNHTYKVRVKKILNDLLYSGKFCYL